MCVNVCVSVGVPRPLRGPGGAAVLPAGGGCQEPRGTDPPQPGLLPGPPGVCVPAAPSRGHTHVPRLLTQENGRARRRYTYKQILLHFAVG